MPPEKQKGSQERTSPGSDNAVEDGSAGPLPCPPLTSSGVGPSPCGTLTSWYDSCCYFTITAATSRGYVVRILLWKERRQARLPFPGGAQIVELAARRGGGGDRGGGGVQRRRGDGAIPGTGASAAQRQGGASSERRWLRRWREGEGEVSRGRR